MRRDELAPYWLLTNEHLLLDDMGLKTAQITGAFIEVTCDDQVMQE